MRTMTVGAFTIERDASRASASEPIISVRVEGGDEAPMHGVQLWDFLHFFHMAVGAALLKKGERQQLPVLGYDVMFELCLNEDETLSFFDHTGAEIGRRNALGVMSDIAHAYRSGGE